MGGPAKFLPCVTAAVMQGLLGRQQRMYDKPWLDNAAQGFQYVQH
jgi:hypothetical protein